MSGEGFLLLVSGFPVGEEKVNRDKITIEAANERPRHHVCSELQALAKPFSSMALLLLLLLLLKLRRVLLIGLVIVAMFDLVVRRIEILAESPAQDQDGER